MSDASTTFHPATPAMIVGHSTSAAVPPLGLGEPFALLGGDRLGPSGIPFTVAHEWQPAFLNAVTAACGDLLIAERPWFRMRPTVLVGPDGAGRTHAARSLARAAGVPHVILNLSDPVIAANIAASGEINEALWVSPVVTAMAATRCANPVVTVIGTDRHADAAVSLAAMIDPVFGRAWDEDRIATVVDLGEVTWIVQAATVAELPVPLRDHLAVVPMQHVPCVRDSQMMVSLLAEVLDDLNLSPADPAVSWNGIALRLSWRSWLSPKQAYGALRSAVIDAQYAFAVSRLQSADTDSTDQQPQD
ncbi:hypothetical protein BH10PSE14_BH10PSE14_35240 [soil metagenome]